MSTRSRWTLLAVGAAAAVFAVVWLVVAVVVPLVETTECAGVEFGAAPTAGAGQTGGGEPPPIGGRGGLAGDLRSALRGDDPAVYCNDFADPFVLRVGSAYYAYSTNTEEFRVPVLTSSGLFGTASRSEALTGLPA
ncbi:MAG TPA: hypothetical protein VF152_10180, partial [Acidimicrobiia bacterium]